MIEVTLSELTDEQRQGSVFIAINGQNAKVYYEGDTVPPAQVGEPVTVVRLTQFRIALSQLGMLNSINAAVAAADMDTKIWWEYSVDVYSDNKRIADMASALGISPAQVKAVFDLAKTVKY